MGAKPSCTLCRIIKIEPGLLRCGVGNLIALVLQRRDVASAGCERHSNLIERTLKNRNKRDL